MSVPRVSTKRKPRLWFYKPTIWWYGWRTFVPVWLGGDEWGRRTLVIGWNFIGQLVIAIGKEDTDLAPFAASPSERT